MLYNLRRASPRGDTMRVAAPQEAERTSLAVPRSVDCKYETTVASPWQPLPAWISPSAYLHRATSQRGSHASGARSRLTRHRPQHKESCWRHPVHPTHAQMTTARPTGTQIISPVAGTAPTKPSTSAGGPCEWRPRPPLPRSAPYGSRMTEHGAWVRACNSAYQFEARPSQSRLLRRNLSAVVPLCSGHHQHSNTLPGRPRACMYACATSAAKCRTELRPSTPFFRFLRSK